MLATIALKFLHELGLAAGGTQDIAYTKKDIKDTKIHAPPIVVQILPIVVQILPTVLHKSQILLTFIFIAVLAVVRLLALGKLAIL